MSCSLQISEQVQVPWSVQQEHGGHQAEAEGECGLHVRPVRLQPGLAAARSSSSQTSARLGEEAQSDLQRGLQDELLQVLRLLLGEREKMFIQEVSNKVEWVSFSLGRRKVSNQEIYLTQAFPPVAERG